jgi:hypothetical protein
MRVSGAGREMRLSRRDHRRCAASPDCRTWDNVRTTRSGRQRAGRGTFSGMQYSARAASRGRSKECPARRCGATGGTSCSCSAGKSYQEGLLRSRQHVPPTHQNTPWHAHEQIGDEFRAGAGTRESRTGEMLKRPVCGRPVQVTADSTRNSPCSARAVPDFLAAQL